MNIYTTVIKYPLATNFGGCWRPVFNIVLYKTKKWQASW